MCSRTKPVPVEAVGKLDSEGRTQPLQSVGNQINQNNWKATGQEKYEQNCKNEQQFCIAKPKNQERTICGFLHGGKRNWKVCTSTCRSTDTVRYFKCVVSGGQRALFHE